MVQVVIPNMPNVEIDEDLISAWIEDRLNDAKNHFIMQMGRSTGRGGATYRRGGRLHVASAPGEYPVTDGGRLVGSPNVEVDKREGSLFSDVGYAKWLTEGTKYMDPRKMFADAISDTLKDRPEDDQLAKAAHVT